LVGWLVGWFSENKPTRATNTTNQPTQPNQPAHTTNQPTNQPNPTNPHNQQSEKGAQVDPLFVPPVFVFGACGAAFSSFFKGA
jgi:hypothetical protein